MASFTVTYTALIFKEPTERISESHFNHYKQELLKDSRYKFYKNASYLKYVGATLITILISSAVTWGCWLWINNAEAERNTGALYNIVLGILIISGLLAIYQYYVWISETKSYIEYRMASKKYYKTKKVSMLNANSYDAFISGFYKN